MKNIGRGILAFLAVIVVALAFFFPLRNREPQEAYKIIKVGECEYIQFANGQTLHSAVCPNPKHEEVPGNGHAAVPVKP